MSTVAPPRPASTLAAPEVYRLTVAEYERLADAAVLDDDRVELLDGYLVRKMPEKPPHIWTVATVLRALEVRLRGWWCRKEDPVRIPKYDEPEPDVAVVRGSLDDYRDRTPGPKDVGLLVEVADSTLDRDRGEKKIVYARARIPVYWIINLVDRQVEVYSDPRRGQYRTSQVFRPGQDLPLVIDGVEIGRIPVADLLP
jgi:Uma2 family endonuclease